MLFTYLSKIRIPILSVIVLGLLTLALTPTPKDILISPQGFSQQSINIVVGQKVTWKNIDDLSHWPASDPHPIHNGYPSPEKGCISSSLDACRGLTKGQSYSFIFDKAGSWGIHDHLFHSHTMTVNVYKNYSDLMGSNIEQLLTGWKEKFISQPTLAETNTPLKQAVDRCTNSDRTKFIACLKDALGGVVGKIGVKGLLTELDKSFRENDSSMQGGITRCHDIAHAIGQSGITTLGNPKQVLSECSDLCTSGCFHGAVEQTVLEQSTDTFLNNLNDLCSNGACDHGLGHGLASIAGFDLEKSLKLCDRLGDQESQRNCGFGVFMEIYEPSSFNPVPKALPEDLLSFCNELSGVYLEVCFRNISSYEYARTNQDIQKALAICRSIPQNFARECRVALGQQIYFNKQGNSLEIITVCRNAKETEFQDCLEGALMSATASDPLARHGFELCSAVEEASQQNCYQFLEGQIQ